MNSRRLARAAGSQKAAKNAKFTKIARRGDWVTRSAAISVATTAGTQCGVQTGHIGDMRGKWCAVRTTPSAAPSAPPRVL